MTTKLREDQVTRGIVVQLALFDPVTKKGTEVPMGGGKGAVDHYVFPLKPGRIIFEIDGIKEEAAREALERATDKLSLKTKFIKRSRQ